MIHLLPVPLKGPSSGDVWQPATSWSEDNTWKWDTSAIIAGSYQIGVWVKDQIHEGQDFSLRRRKQII